MLLFGGGGRASSQVDEQDLNETDTSVNDTAVNMSLFKAPRCSLGVSGSYSVGNQVMLCIFLSTNPVQKLIFRLKVDEFSSLMLRGSSQRSAANSSRQPVYAWVTSTMGDADATPLNCADGNDIRSRGDMTSCPQIYSSASYIATLHSLVVNFVNGKVRGFAWDNGCEDCGPQSCMRPSKFFAVNTSTPSGDTFAAGVCSKEKVKCSLDASSNCDMAIVVTWAGTDSAGKNLLSAGRRLSQFRGYTLKSMYETADANQGTWQQAALKYR